MKGRKNLLGKYERLFSWKCGQSEMEVRAQIFLECLSVVTTMWCWCQPHKCEVREVSQCERKGHKPSVSLDSIDAGNLITGNENQWLESTIRGMGQDYCFPLRYLGEILHFVTYLLTASLFSGSRDAQETDSWRLTGWLLSLKVHCFEKWPLKNMEERSASKRKVEGKTKRQTPHLRWSWCLTTQLISELRTNFSSESPSSFTYKGVFIKPN